MKNIHNYKRKLLCMLLLLLITSICYSVDPSIYNGKWVSKTEELTIEIIICDNGVKNVKVNNKFLENIKFDFVYGKNATIPFLYIFSDDGKKENDNMGITHSLYLIYGCPENRDSNIMTGIYELAKIRNDHYGTVDSKEFLVEFREKKGKK